MTVHLVGAGPGHADHLTLRAARLLSSADVVVHDRLVDRSVLELARSDAVLVDVGKEVGGSTSQDEINELLISLGRRWPCVVRLKGGDPFVFGRGGEELVALRSAGIDCEVTPGVTSALAAPLAAGIPATYRGLARGVTVVTGHAFDGDGGHLERIAHPELTLVILMGAARRAEIARQLIRGGLPPSTPVAAIEWACTARETVTRGILEDLERLAIGPPAVIVVGRVAAVDLAPPVEVPALVGS